MLCHFYGIHACINSDTEEVADELEQPAIEIPEGENNEQSMNTEINVPGDADTDNMISISVENLGRANPFLPPGEATLISERAKTLANSVPNTKLSYELLPPLEGPNIDGAAKQAVSSRISGIMYDKNSPSAILNFAGVDYLVRSGDVINGYKVLAINRNTVTIQVGPNVYSAQVGQLVEEGMKELRFNAVANLENKFGGSGRK